MSDLAPPLSGNPLQEPDRFMILSVLSAPCGDMLKAQVLAAAMPATFGRLDLTRIKLPPGAAERAFQEAAAVRTQQGIKPIEPVQAASSERMSGAPAPLPPRTVVAADEASSTATPAVPLKAMPAMRFEDVEPLRKPTPTEPTDRPAAEGFEPGPEWVTFEEAAKLRGCSYPNIVGLVARKGWRKERGRTHPRRFLVARADVMTGVSA